jgi:hypothetical protein
VDLHLVLDNASTHSHPVVKAWLAKHPRFHLHFTPTSASWMDQVETCFSVLSRQAIRRGVFRSVGALADAIKRFIDAWNEARKPFVWVKTADQILGQGTPSTFPSDGALGGHCPSSKWP